MAKEKANLYQEMEFDSYAYAQSVIDERTEYLSKISKYVLVTRCHFIVLVALVILMFVFSSRTIGDIAETVMGIGIIIGIVCYVKIGGIKTAFSWGLNVGKFCWYLIPIFPIDVFVLFSSIFFIPLVILFAPYVIVRHQEKQALNDINDAQEYMKFCKPVEDAGEEQ